MKSVLVMLDPISLPRLEGISAYAKEHRWALILEDRLPGHFDFARLDGALTSLRGRSGQLAKLRRLQRFGKPVVDLTVACPRMRLPRVASDHRALGALAARHFLERGFSNFAWFSSSWSKVHELRYRGFAQTLKGRQVTRLTALQTARPPNVLSLPKPLAVLAYDEPDAARVIAECRALRVPVPGDVAVLGIGNDPFLCENGDVTISSVDQNLAFAAREACALLDRLMSTPPPPARHAPITILIPPAGVIPRASTDTLAHPDPQVRKALVYIHKHLTRAFGAAETAEALAIPRSTLDHLFTAKLGHSVGREILGQRLLRAKRLLKDETIQLKAIAKACGFCNASYFTNSFRRETGLSPKVWRRKHAAA